MNIAAAMAALAITELKHEAKMCALVVACRADQDTLGGWPVGRLAADLGRHPGAISRTLRAVPGKYLVVNNSVVSLGNYFEPRNLSRRVSRNASRTLRGVNLVGIKDKRNGAGETEAGAAGDKAAAAAALEAARDTLAHSITARTDRRRR